MRIISGKYKAKKLNTLKSNDTRPTSDKVRESVFSMLGSIEGSVLDLFGGTGGLAIEALSRGADSAMIIDGAGDAIKIIKENTKGIDEPVEIFRNDYRRALKAMGKREKSFDLIFLDPPYNKKLIDKSLELIEEYNILHDGGRIVAEAGKNETFKHPGFEIVKEHNYGSIKVWVLIKEGK
ncbi:Ribosomal RNA small subunit methyltransferase D [Jeotgalicoccus saudimassiliensis]|uniref:Ribosomal RNA small subunit methyltransferase D n=2 Tax=Jeotgalicoccus saudimassiliensis TaxID=1461582 RepID=A0A078M3U7_9STAP|nr:Ribosomal RNA small subunit methyltransferase D [Jeotgalicoccus saudimassiliensis]